MRTTPQWYSSGNVVDSIAAAKTISGVGVDDIVDVLTEHEFDSERDRVRSLVESQLTTLEAASGTDNGSSGQRTADEPRDLHERFAGAEDVEYLSEREFARVLGVVLSRYEGSYRTPAAVDELDVDLFWNRSHVTVGFRTVSQPAETPVDAEVIQHVIQGKTNPPTGRNPSILGIVTNSEFTDDARALAAENDIELFSKEYLEQWVSDAKLSLDVFGAILEEGEQQESDLEEAVDDLPKMPETIQSRDPLAAVSRDTWDIDDAQTGQRPTVKERMPIEEEHPDDGKHGRLYADPSEDGDFGAFDEYLDGLTTEGSDQ